MDLLLSIDSDDSVIVCFPVVGVWWQRKNVSHVGGSSDSVSSLVKDPMSGDFEFVVLLESDSVTTSCWPLGSPVLVEFSVSTHG